MDASVTATSTSPFPPGYRASGLLLHITSLPSPYGIGDLGPGAFEWIDRLHEAGQTWWQALPFGPTGYGDSPYQSLTSFLGSVMMVSPQFLIEDGLLEADDCAETFPDDTVAYEAVIPFKLRLLRKAWTNFRKGARKDLMAAYEAFCLGRASWLEDYALFRALKSRFNESWYLEWPQELVLRTPSALAQARRELADEIDQIRVSQFFLSRQAERLKAHARAKGVRIIGDLPFFVSQDSSDVWAHPEMFLLDERRRPRFVAGVPPDYFSATGQLWGNPVYDWEALSRTGYAWCIERMRALLAHVDLVRLDHFRAFAAAWHVPAGSPNAIHGEWVPGPGARFFHAAGKEFEGLPFIAEDLGVITPEVCAVRDEFQIPGTRVLQFAFDGNPDNIHLPNDYSANNVVYTATHDNATTREWYQGLPDHERQHLWRYLGGAAGEACDAVSEMIRLAWCSPAALAITPLQDVLHLGGEARMNVPGRAAGNWRWRATPRMLAGKNFEWLSDLTDATNRRVCDNEVRNESDTVTA